MRSYTTLFFLLASVLLLSCQPKKAEMPEGAEEAETVDIWEGVPIEEFVDTRPVQVRYTEVTQQLDSLWQDIHTADSIKHAALRALEGTLPQTPGFAMQKEFATMVAHSRWLEKRPLTYQIIGTTDEIEAYDQHLDGFIELADSIIQNTRNLDAETARYLNMIFDADADDLLRRTRYESLVQTHNQILEEQKDSLEYLGFQNLSPLPIFAYQGRIQ
ncbi:MAG: hypothetical protein ACFCUI_01180 [Bernardetiaceae bacterium]